MLGEQTACIQHRIAEPRSDRALIFIHGYSGHPEKTWGKFPTFLAEDSELDQWDVYSIGYESRLSIDLLGLLWSGNPDVKLLANQLIDQIRLKPFREYRRLAIVAHSMGGLVVQRAIVKSNEFAARIQTLILFGTPSKGLKKAGLVRLLNRQFRSMSEDGEFIGKLRARWNQSYKKPHFDFCAVAGARDRFVPAKSSLSVFKKRYQWTVPGNHLQIVKPKRSNHQSVAIVKERLKKVPRNFDEITDDDGRLIKMAEECLKKKKIARLKKPESRERPLQLFERGLEILRAAADQLPLLKSGITSQSEQWTNAEKNFRHLENWKELHELLHQIQNSDSSNLINIEKRLQSSPDKLHEMRSELRKMINTLSSSFNSAKSQLQESIDSPQTETDLRHKCKYCRSFVDRILLELEAAKSNVAKPDAATQTLQNIEEANRYLRYLLGEMHEIDKKIKFFVEEIGVDDLGDLLGKLRTTWETATGRNDAGVHLFSSSIRCFQYICKTLLHLQKQHEAWQALDELLIDIDENLSRKAQKKQRLVPEMNTQEAKGYILANEWEKIANSSDALCELDDKEYVKQVYDSINILKMEIVKAERRGRETELLEGLKKFPILFGEFKSDAHSYFHDLDIVLKNFSKDLVRRIGHPISRFLLDNSQLTSQ